MSQSRSQSSISLCGQLSHSAIFALHLWTLCFCRWISHSLVVSEEPLAAPPSVMSGRADGSGRDGTAYSVVISVLYNTDNTGWHLCVLLYYTYFVLIQYKYVLCIT